MGATTVSHEGLDASAGAHRPHGARRDAGISRPRGVRRGFGISRPRGVRRGFGTSRPCAARRAARRDASHLPRRPRAAALVVAALLACVIALAGCSADSPSAGSPVTDAATQPAAATAPLPEVVDNTQTFEPTSGSPSATLKVASGSENEEAARAIQVAVDASGVAVEMHYMGSLDIMDALSSGGGDYDAVWPASSIWISMGDANHLVKGAQSTSTTPVVLGVAKSKAIELGWADDSGATTSPTTAQVIDAVRAGALSFAMTSATQSNSGATAYLAFLTALAGKDTPLTADDLANTQLQSQMASLLSGVDRSSGSSDWLKDMVVRDPASHQAMVNYESLVSQADRELEQQGDEPLLAVYPADGIAVSDSPLGYVDRGQGLDDAFSAFQQALASDDAKLQLERVGRRTGLGGRLSFPDDAEVRQAFRADWGISTDASVLKAVPMPAADVTRQALDLYQTGLRRASTTIWVVDYSGSMQGAGKQGVVEGLTQALDPTEAAKAMIQPRDGDTNELVAFSGDVLGRVTATGTDTAALLQTARDTEAVGGTNIYAGLEAALDDALDAQARGTSTVAIVLMTDGVSEVGDKQAFEQDYRDRGQGIPVFSIMFGDADPSQLDELSELTNGKTFDGRTEDLASVFKQVKGYN